MLRRGKVLADAALSERVEAWTSTREGRVLAKLGARDRVHAFILAHRLGHVATDDDPTLPR